MLREHRGVATRADLHGRMPMLSGLEVTRKRMNNAVKGAAWLVGVVGRKGETLAGRNAT